MQQSAWHHFQSTASCELRPELIGFYRNVRPLQGKFNSIIASTYLLSLILKEILRKLINSSSLSSFVMQFFFLNYLIFMFFFLFISRNCCGNKIWQKKQGSCSFFLY